MPKYNVTIEIDYKSYHEEEIEAESETDAEDVAKERFWDDEYIDELRMNRENHDEHYEATEIIEKQTCPICKHTWEKVEEETEYNKVKEFNDSDKTIYEP
jgi:hypothetical protein